MEIFIAALQDLQKNIITEPFSNSDDAIHWIRNKIQAVSRGEFWVKEDLTPEQEKQGLTYSASYGGCVAQVAARTLDEPRLSMNAVNVAAKLSAPRSTVSVRRS